MRLILNEEHLELVVREGMLQARSSLEIMTADLKAMLVPEPGVRHARSVLAQLNRLAGRSVDIRILHAGVPSAAALHELRGGLHPSMTLRRCPRVHAKIIVVDSRWMYVGSANLTGAGLGAKSPTRRNFEAGVWLEDDHAVDRILDQFNQLWEGGCCDACGRRDVCPAPLEEPDLVADPSKP